MNSWYKIRIRHHKTQNSWYSIKKNTTVTWSTTERREIRYFSYLSVFELCDRMDKERGIGTDSNPNELPNRVKEEKRDKMIGQNPKAEVAPFSSA